MRRTTLALVLLLAFAVPALAQSSLGIGTAEMPVQPGSGALFRWIAAQQQAFFASLRAALVALRGDPAAGMGWLAALSFAYGVFHAAGPGHGKAVISSYMLANEVELRRGVLLSFASAFVQALAALVLVGAGWFVLRGSAWTMTEAGRVIELASYGLVALFGAWLLLQKGRRLARRVVFAPAPALATGALRFADAAEPGQMPVMRRASGGFSSEICHGDDECDCGRSHMVDPGVAARGGFRSAAAAVLAVGLRPCAGAVVVLTFALVNGLYLAGVLSVLAMALGTAITVSALASLAVYAKGFATRVSGSRAGLVAEGLEILGAVALLVLGLGLLAATL